MFDLSGRDDGPVEDCGDASEFALDLRSGAVCIIWQGKIETEFVRLLQGVSSRKLIAQQGICLFDLHRNPHVTSWKTIYDPDLHKKVIVNAAASKF